MIQNESLNIKVIGSAYSSFRQEMPALCEEMLARRYVDICGLGRQSFADPLTPAKLQSGESVSWCALCSGCTKLMVSQRNDGCVVYNDYYKQELKKLNAK